VSTIGRLRFLNNPHAASEEAKQYITLARDVHSRKITPAGGAWNGAVEGAKARV
jgi:hypothetical protein